MSCDPDYTFSIDGHQMTVIETDATNTQPLAVDSIQLFAGQRYSFILEANQTIDNYWIRSNPGLGVSGYDNGINSAILRYVGAPEVEPTTNATSSTMPLKETDLHPLTPMPVVRMFVSRIFSTIILRSHSLAKHLLEVLIKLSIWP